MASGSGFQLVPVALPLTLDPGDSVDLSVTFAPQSGGGANGVVSVTTSDTPKGGRRGRIGSNFLQVIAKRSAPRGANFFSIPLTGTGIAPGQLGPSLTNVNFGNVTVGDTASHPVTLTNTGGVTVTVTQANVSGAGFSLSGLNLPLALEPGGSSSFTVSFNPQSPGNAGGNVAIVSDAGNSPLNLPLSGTGIAAGSLSADPARVDFGSVQVGASQEQPVMLTNHGGADVNITQAAVTGAGFSISGLSLPLTLGPGEKTSFTAKFAPESPGAANGSISITNDGANPALEIPLSATGVTPGALVADPSNFNFGNVQVGKSQTQPGTLINTGGSSVTITQATVTGSGFSISGLNLPLTLPAGQSTNLSVKFSPQSPGTVNGNIAIISDGSNPTLNVPLSGTGVAAGFLTPDPASISFGNVQVGKNQQQSETITNTGGSDVTISQANVTGAGFSISGLNLPLTLTPGQGKTFTVTFAPQSPGTANGNIAIMSDGSNPTLNVPLSGTGVAPGYLSTDPPSFDFGNVQVGQKQAQQETLTNTGGVTLTVTQATVTGDGFSISGLTLPLTLTPGQRFTFGVSFTPPSGGNFSGNIALVSDGSNPNVDIPLLGMGKVAGQLGVSPPTLDFGDVTVGSNKNLAGTLAASGASVIVSSYSISSSEFTLSGLAFPFTVTPGQDVPFTVTFAPQMSGIASSTLSFVSDASNSPTVENLTGNGVAPPPDSVDLSWNASPTPEVVGYNIYRGGNSGGPYTKINSGLDATTAYTDDSVQAGQTYYYVTAAVDGGGSESGYSNEAQAVIPAP